MATEIPAGDSQYLIDDDDTTYVLEKGVMRSGAGPDAAIFTDGTTHGDTLNLKGHVKQFGGTWAVQISGDDQTVNVAATGTIHANSAIEFNGADAVLNNAGKITSTTGFGDAIYYEGLNTTINNDGTLQGGYGIQISDVRTTINLGTHSQVTGTKAGIYSAATEATEKVDITNHGHITGDNTDAIYLGDADDTVVNKGTISGGIYLGTGKDVFDNRGGTVDSPIRGGSGDDTLITDDAHVKLQENGGSEGYDTVKSTVSYTLSANVERLMLIGKADIDGTGTNGGSDLFGNNGDNHPRQEWRRFAQRRQGHRHAHRRRRQRHLRLQDRLRPRHDHRFRQAGRP